MGVSIPPDDELLCLVALSDMRGAWGVPWRRLVADFGSARALWAASDAELERAGFNERGRRRLRNFKAWEILRRRLDGWRRQRVEVCGLGDTAYPAALLTVEDGPLVLYYRGATPSVHRLAVSVVGARKASDYGLRTARRLGREASACGLVVVSGMARGIDAEAQRGALENGASVAVLGCSPERPYPESSSRLYRQLLERGTVLSEFPPGTELAAWQFPRRNRIVTGMSAATVVIEAGEGSGSLISAKLALAQGRELLAVPGPVDSQVSRGSNALIRDGCTPLLEITDLLAALGMHPSGSQGLEVSARTTRCSPAEQGLLDLLATESLHIDDVVRRTGLDRAAILALITSLELIGLIKRQSSGSYARVA